MATSITANDFKLNGTSIVPVWATITLTADGWNSSALTQTVTCSGVTASNMVIVIPTSASFSTWTDAGITSSSQDDGSLVFSCTTVPSADVTAVVACINTEVA